MQASKIKFYTSFNVPPSRAEKKCEKIRPEYTLNVATGKLEKTGEDKFYERIQTHLQSTKLDVKLKKYAMGDYTALGFANNQYIDTTTFPTNLADVLKSGERAKAQFGELPAEIKQLFDNDYSKLVASITDGTFDSIITNFASSKFKDGSSSGGQEPAAAAAAS